MKWAMLLGFLLTLQSSPLLARESRWKGPSSKSDLMPERETGGLTADFGVKIIAASSQVNVFGDMQSEVELYLVIRRFEKDVVSRVVEDENDLQGNRVYALCIQFNNEMIAKQTYEDLRSHFQASQDPRLINVISVISTKNCDHSDGGPIEGPPGERGKTLSSPTEPRAPSL